MLLIMEYFPGLSQFIYPELRRYNPVDLRNYDRFSGVLFRLWKPLVHGTIYITTEALRDKTRKDAFVRFAKPISSLKKTNVFSQAIFQFLPGFESSSNSAFENVIDTFSL